MKKFRQAVKATCRLWGWGVGIGLAISQHQNATWLIFVLAGLMPTTGFLVVAQAIPTSPVVNKHVPAGYTLQPEFLAGTTHIGYLQEVNRNNQVLMQLIRVKIYCTC
jgi:hypothetical protein